MRHFWTVIICITLLGAPPAYAAGFAVKEFSAEAMATAYAGAAASDTDAGYLPYNPAAAAGVANFDGTMSMVGILPGSNANYTTSLTSAGTPTGGHASPRNFIRDALIPSIEFRDRLSPRWSVGLSVYAPWGLSTSYSETWAGRYYAGSTKLITVNATPVVAYEVLPGLTIGGGAQVEYAKGRLTSTIDTGTLGLSVGVPGAVPGQQDSYAKLSGTSWAAGFVLGAIWRPAGDLAIGLSYRSALSHDLKGPLTFRTDAAGVGDALQAAAGLFQNTRQTTPITMPPVVSFGTTYDLSDDWMLAAEVDWMGWSRFRKLVVTAANPDQPPDETLTRWNNSLFGSLGVRYALSRGWKLSAGIAYDQSPVPNATREPRIPDADRFWISAGVGYRLNDHADLDFTASRLFNRSSQVSLDPSIAGDALRGYLSGTTHSYVNVVGVQINYHI